MRLSPKLLMLVKLSLCVVFARSGFYNEKSRKDLSLLCSKCSSCYQTLCDLGMSKHFISYVSVFRDNFRNVCYNFPIAFCNVYHQRCAIADVCSYGLEENKSKTDMFCSKTHWYGYG